MTPTRPGHERPPRQRLRGVRRRFRRPAGDLQDRGRHLRRLGRAGRHPARQQRQPGRLLRRPLGRAGHVPGGVLLLGRAPGLVTSRHRPRASTTSTTTARRQDQPPGSFAYHGGNGEGFPLRRRRSHASTATSPSAACIYVEGDLKINGNCWILGGVVGAGQERRSRSPTARRIAALLSTTPSSRTSRSTAATSACCPGASSAPQRQPPPGARRAA